jgi:hypothetical protein
MVAQNTLATRLPQPPLPVGGNLKSVCKGSFSSSAGAHQQGAPSARPLWCACAELAVFKVPKVKKGQLRKLRIGERIFVRQRDGTADGYIVNTGKEGKAVCYTVALPEVGLVGAQGATHLPRVACPMHLPPSPFFGFSLFFIQTRNSSAWVSGIARWTGTKPLSCSSPRSCCLQAPLSTCLLTAPLDLYFSPADHLQQRYSGPQATRYPYGDTHLCGRRRTALRHLPLGCRCHQQQVEPTRDGGSCWEAKVVPAFGPFPTILAVFRGGGLCRCA